MMSKRQLVSCSPFLFGILIVSAAPASGQETVDLSPAKWPTGELESFHALDAKFGGQHTLATSDTAVISGTTSATAIRAGLEAFRQGGNAVDAALTTSLTQIALAKGCWVSYAGIMTMVYYDAESDQFYCLNAGYDTFRGEESPLTIPKTESGRTALVPGYMAGVQAAHDRFGSLPFDQLFQPAIYFASDGFELNQFHQALINSRKDVLSRFEDTKSIFTDEEGEFYQQGDLFRQIELAVTLRSVAADGAAHMYTGPWATRFVDTVRADGGKVTAKDLAEYRVMWTEPLRIEYSGFEVVAPGLPGQGGVHIAETLNVLNEADHRSMGHYSESAESFFWLSQAQNLFALSFLPEETTKFLTGRDATMSDRLSDDYAADIWGKMKEGTFGLTQKPKELGDNHSDAIVAIDSHGNMVAIVHTINTASWGQTGIFVDGISIPDSASFQQQLIQQTGPGKRLPDPTQPLIVVKDGKPMVALSSIGAGLHQKTMACLTNLIDHRFNLKKAIDAPSMHLPQYSPSGAAKQTIFEGDFSEPLIDRLLEMGLNIEVVPGDLSSRAPRGYVVGAAIDNESGQRSAIATDTLNAGALGLENK